MALLLAIIIAGSNQAARGAADSFVNFETPPVHPVALSPDGSQLAVCNLADGRLELFDVSSGTAVPVGSVPVGLDPVSVRYRTPSEAWVVNHISDSISVVNVTARQVVATLRTLDTPADVIFAGSAGRAFVSCATPNTVQVFDAVTRQPVTNLVIAAERPKALAVSPDGSKVYAAIFESGNGTTVLGPRLTSFFSGGSGYSQNDVSDPSSPYGGQNPPPNSGTNFSPAIKPQSSAPLPTTSVVVRKNSAGRWMDDNSADWTAFVSGTNAALTDRVQGWDLPDRDVAVIDTGDFSVTYATGLMNLCMGIGVNPASGLITVVGTEAINEVRFEPNLNGIFIRSKIGLVDPLTLNKTVKDLNPHLDYASRTLPQSERDKSIGEPRGIVWNSSGTRGYVTGMGSRNLVVIDASGARARALPIELSEGPLGLALDEGRSRLYVLNRFSSSLSVVDTASETLVADVPLFDPTPRTVKDGRRHLYDTRLTSGLGQASCASCHPDARMDRLAWDLGDPSGEVLQTTMNFSGSVMPVTYHPMKGVMMTQTLQDIIGHEPFHWRGDRSHIGEFNQTFTNLLAAPTALSPDELRELGDFLATVRIPPNPYRTLENGLSTSVPLPGHKSLTGAPLPNGNAASGYQSFRSGNGSCITCHTLPTGLGIEFTNNATGSTVPYIGTNGEHHVALVSRLEGGLPAKTAQFRNILDKVGMDGASTQSRAGFGFGHDGGSDTLVRFVIAEGRLTNQSAQVVANLVSFLLSVSGSDLAPATNSGLLRIGPASQDVPAGVGRQLTLNAPQHLPLLDSMLALAYSPTSRLDLIAKGSQAGSARGWFYDRSAGLFQSDRRNERVSAEALIGLANAGSEITFTLVAQGTGQRLGIDRDSDGVYDGDELDAGTNPADPQSYLRIESVMLGGLANGELHLGFTAVSNHTYTVQSRDRFDSGPWSRWVDVVAHPTNRFVTLTNSLPGSAESRAFRLVTPRAP
jgi:DNA-binding beta-propeller fold protein YncE